MNNYHYLLLLIVSASCASYAMEDYSAHVIVDLSTKIFIPETNSYHEVFSLLLYPNKDADNFKKTHLINIITHTRDDATGSKKGEYVFQQQKKEAVKQGRLDSLTLDNVDDIADGYATYHYGIKSSSNDSGRMDIGAFVIDKNTHLVLKQERNLICRAALVRKLNKNKNYIKEQS
jgi:hypothetical protein